METIEGARQAASELLRAKNHWMDRAVAAERERDRCRDASREADEQLMVIADDASEDIGTRIDSVRALLKGSL